jgi:hypothetical protein
VLAEISFNFLSAAITSEKNARSLPVVGIFLFLKFVTKLTPVIVKILNYIRQGFYA